MRIAIVIWLICSSCSAAIVRLSWDAADSSESSAVTEYIVYYGNAPGYHTNHQSAGLSLTATIEGLSDSLRYYFVVTAKNANGESFVSNEVTYRKPTINPLTNIVLQAEQGILRDPMVALPNSLAIDGLFVMTTNTDQGYCTIIADIPFADDYVIWARVWSPNDGRDSFYVTHESFGTDVYDTVKDYKDLWQWTLVNGRGGILQPFTDAFKIDPRIFSMNPGTNAIAFQGRETGTGLDAIIVTNDKTLVPRSPDTPLNLQLTVEQ